MYADREKKSLVIAIRGTLSISDMFTGITGGYIFWKIISKNNCKNFFTVILIIKLLKINEFLCEKF